MTNIEHLSHAIGVLDGTVKSLSSQWQRQELSAVEGRKVLYDRFEGLALDVRQMSTKLDALLVEHTSEVMPTIDAYKLSAARDAGRRIGFLFAGKLVWAFTIGVFTVLGFVLHELINYLRGH